MILQDPKAGEEAMRLFAPHRTAPPLMVDTVKFVPDDPLEIFRCVSTGAVLPCAVSDADQLVIH